MMILREMLDCAREIGADTAARGLSDDAARRELLAFLIDDGVDVNSPCWAMNVVVANVVGAFDEGRMS